MLREIVSPTDNSRLRLNNYFNRLNGWVVEGKGDNMLKRITLALERIAIALEKLCKELDTEKIYSTITAKEKTYPMNPNLDLYEKGDPYP